MSTKMYRQGDVGFVAIETEKPILIDEGYGPEFNAGMAQMPGHDNAHNIRIARTSVIRRGEHGGVHQLDKSAIKNGDAKMYDVLDEAGAIVARYLEVIGESADIVHHEHNTLTLPHGWYEIRIQREFFQDRERYVAD